jgi:hypothetical protein
VRQPIRVVRWRLACGLTFQPRGLRTLPRAIFSIEWGHTKIQCLLVRVLAPPRLFVGAAVLAGARPRPRSIEAPPGLAGARDHPTGSGDAMKRRTKTPQTVIDAWRPHRERLRPRECDHRDGCWVYDPFGSCRPGGLNNNAPRCNACGGKLAVDRGHRAGHQKGTRRDYP